MMSYTEKTLDSVKAAKVKAKIDKAYVELEKVKAKSKRSKKALLKQLVELKTIEGLIEYLKKE